MSKATLSVALLAVMVLRQRPRGPSPPGRTAENRPGPRPAKECRRVRGPGQCD